jgi:hypothetical protein
LRHTSRGSRYDTIALGRLLFKRSGDVHVGTPEVVSLGRGLTDVERVEESMSEMEETESGPESRLVRMALLARTQAVRAARLVVMRHSARRRTTGSLSHPPTTDALRTASSSSDPPRPSSRPTPYAAHRPLASSRSPQSSRRGTRHRSAPALRPPRSDPAMASTRHDAMPTPSSVRAPHPTPTQPAGRPRFHTQGHHARRGT